jgi:hypothetical protein
MNGSVRLPGVVLLALLSTSVASAQSQSGSEGQQVFKPLSLWEKVKLGAAYFTNPQLSQQLQISYGYDPAEFDPAKLSDLEKQGTVTCVVTMAPKNSSTPKTFSFTVGSCHKTSSPAYVVSASSDLLGKKPDAILRVTNPDTTSDR